MWQDHCFLILLFFLMQIFSSMRNANAEYSIVPDLEHSMRESEAENELRRNANDIDDVGERTFFKRNMDPIDRSGFSSFVKKNMDPIDRSGFSDFVKKNMDPIDRSGFNNFLKRKLQEGFKQMIRKSKKNMDPIDRSGFSDLSKRMPRSAPSGCLFQ